MAVVASFINVNNKRFFKITVYHALLKVERERNLCQESHWNSQMPYQWGKSPPHLYSLLL